MINTLPTLRTLTSAFAAGRIAYAAGLLAAPGTLTRPWVGPDADRAATQVGMRGLGGRDLAVSIALLLAARHDQPLRPWLIVCAAGDLGDVAATALAGARIDRSRRYKGVAVAGATAAAGFALAWRG